MRFFRADFVFCCFALAVQAQDLTPAERRRREYPEFANLAELAQSVTPELRAMILTRIGMQPSLKDRGWKLELFEQAFEASQLAFVESRVIAVPPPNGPLPNGIPPRVVWANTNNGVDRLSLATAAVIAMLTVNPAKARELFERIRLPEPRVLKCTEGSVPDTSQYFETAARVGARYPEVLRQAMLRATSAAQMAALAKMLRDAEPELKQSFAGILTSIPVESRAWSINIDEFTQAMSALTDSAGATEKAALLSGWRSYLRRGLTSVQCAEAANPNWGKKGWRSQALESFHQRAVNAGMEPLGETDVENTRAPDSACVDIAASGSDRLQRLSNEGIQFFVANDNEKDAEWHNRFKRFLSSIEEVKKDETVEDPILFKAGMFSMAASAAPEGPLRDYVNNRFLDQLKIANVTSEQFAAWYSAVNSWMALANFRQPKSKTLDILEASGQAMLIAIAKFRQLN
jgi:hypothetical protein